MSDFNRYPGAVPAQDTMARDADLRAFMLSVYNKLALGLVVAGALAWVTGNVPQVTELMFNVTASGRPSFTILGMIVSFAPLALILGSMFFMKNPTATGANVLYWAVVATMGASLGLVFLLYLATSVYSTFFITAAAFGGLSLYGYTTKRSLSGLGTFLIMGLIGLIVASIVNIFLQSSGLGFIISAAGVLIFSGLIAYDTQNLKLSYYSAQGDRNALGVLSSYGALNLFINFVNLFRFLLSIFGSRR
jgi:FtsH-binding integral membrane protein